MIRVNGDELAWEPGMTVLRILELKRYTFPLLIVSVGDDLVQKADYASTPVPDGSEVKVVHLLSGG